MKDPLRNIVPGEEADAIGWWDAEIEQLRGENLALTNEVEVLRFAGDVQGERLTAEIERLLGLLRKIDGILKSGLSASHQRLQIALLIEGAALAGAADQPDAAREIERANLVYERGAFVLMELMKAYERRVRSDCKSQADLDAKPWECAEYRAAADFLRKTWPTPAAADQPDAIPCPHPDIAIIDGVCYCCGKPVASTPTPQPDAGPQAPIIRVSVDEFGSARVVKHYAPGLPPGEYDLYCEPEATAPMLRATDNAAAQPDMVPAPDGCEVEAWELEGGRLEMHRERLKPCS